MPDQVVERRCSFGGSRLLRIETLINESGETMGGVGELLERVSRVGLRAHVYGPFVSASG